MRLPPGIPIPEVTVTAWIVFAQKGNAKAKAGDKKIDREIRIYQSDGLVLLIRRHGISASARNTGEGTELWKKLLIGGKNI